METPLTEQMRRAVVPAGRFRRTPLERSDQRISWDRTDGAFFAAGACHVLAYRCAATRRRVAIGIQAMRRADDGAVVHVVAAWGEWLFDFNGWNPASDLLLANEEFEQTRFNLHPIEAGVEDFCLRWNHRLPNQYHHDPTGRADAFVRRFTPLFMAAATSR
ncbi:MULTISPECIES: hypothetical protein [unclassified Curtobacterium]|uniref:hypothetical protein n=1 Tax=unclassified Curtobacterium TaxID=257496 RepID=UPI003A810CA5